MDYDPLKTESFENACKLLQLARNAFEMSNHEDLRAQMDLVAVTQQALEEAKGALSAMGWKT